jgi:hypothetical protein
MNGRKRQKIVPFDAPVEMRRHVQEVFDHLGTGQNSVRGIS